jgi:hypothetical protein
VKIEPINNKPDKEETKEKEEWIWINGYKATDKDMKCRDFQYELNKQFDMPEDATISTCSSGFHLCRDLDDVFDYYEAKYGNRYFHVRALVRKSDFENYGMAKSHGFFYLALSNNNKIAAKSIEFLSEVSRDELENALVEHYKDSFIELPKEYQARIPEMSIEEATDLIQIDKLVEAGYPRELAEYIAKHDCDNDQIDRAFEVAELKDLSLDTKMVLIFR